MSQKALLLYLEKKVDNFKVNRRGKFPIFTCPSCGENEACRFIPSTSKIHCMACDFEGTLEDVIYLLGEVSHSNKVDDIMEQIYSDFSIQSDKKIANTFDFFEGCGFDLVPLRHMSKKPLELSDWPTREHKDKSEWYKYLETNNNLGIKCGNRSSLTVIDVDQDEIPADIDLMKGDPLIQRTAKGWHLFYKYVPELRSTRINEINTDILNDGRQVVVYPSKITDEDTGKVVNDREFINDFKLIEMPEDLKKYLLSKTEEVTSKEEPQEKVVTFDELSHINLLEKGERNNGLFQLGGILSKQLNSQDMEFAINVINNKLCSPPIPSKEVKALVRSLDKYIKRDEKDLAVHIFKYLNVVEFANSKEIRDALGYPKEDIDKALAYLVYEKQLLKKGRTFSIIKRGNWKQELTVNNNSLPFNVPFLSPYVEFSWGDMILLASKTKRGKTTIAMNFVKELVDQNVQNIYYIGSEAGSRFMRTALALGLKEGDFKWDFIVDPTKVKLEPNAVTVLDWLMISDKSQTDTIFKHFSDQLYETQGVLIAFQQLKQNDQYFAENMSMQYPALSARYIYTDDTGLKGNWHLDAIREPKTHCKTGLIPCTYNPQTKRLTAD